MNNLIKHPRKRSVNSNGI